LQRLKDCERSKPTAKRLKYIPCTGPENRDSFPNIIWCMK
jgi:hypothetical protein